jgi:hypothetical protein
VPALGIPVSTMLLFLLIEASSTRNKIAIKHHVNVFYEIARGSNELFDETLCGF